SHPEVAASQVPVTIPHECQRGWPSVVGGRGVIDIPYQLAWIHVQRKCFRAQPLFNTMAWQPEPFHGACAARLVQPAMQQLAPYRQADMRLQQKPDSCRKISKSHSRFNLG